VGYPRELLIHHQNIYLSFNLLINPLKPELGMDIGFQEAESFYLADAF
jgi:hypothetical protein